MQRHSYLTLRAESGAASESTVTTEGHYLDHDFVSVVHWHIWGPCFLATYHKLPMSLIERAGPRLRLHLTNGAS